MAKKEFTFRGKQIEELMTMDLKEFATLLPSRQKRSLTRGFSEPQKRLLARIKKAKEGKTKKPIKTHCRNMIVIPEMIDITIYIHSGKTFQQVLIQPEMVGHYLGELASTRQRLKHSAPGIGATKSSAAASVK
ncbi:MAG: 30S ribosomal protein S19 [archaeon]